MDPYVLRRIGDVTIERVPTKQGDQQSGSAESADVDGEQTTSAAADHPTPAEKPSADGNHDVAPTPKLHQPYKMKNPGRSTRTESEEEEEEEEEEEFSDEFDSDENDRSPDKEKSNKQYSTNVGKDWGLGSAVSIDSVPKGSGSTTTKSNPKSTTQLPLLSQPENYQPNPPVKSVYNLGSAISLETINSNDNSNSRREFKPYRDDFVSGDRSFDNNKGAVESMSSYHSQPDQKSLNASPYQVPDRGDASDKSDYQVPGDSNDKQMRAPTSDRSQYHRENVRLHQDNESLAQSRDGMSELRKVGAGTPTDVTDFKSFKLGSSVRLEPVGGSFVQSRPNFSESFHGSGLQQTSPSAMGQFSLSNNSSDAKMLTDLDAANNAGGGEGSFKNFLRDDNSSTDFKLGASVSLNPVKSNDHSRSSNDLDSYKSGFRLGSGVSLDIVKPKQDGGGSEEYNQSKTDPLMEQGGDYDDEDDDDGDEETIAARIANSIAGDRQRETPQDVKMKQADEATTDEEDESFEQFGKEQESNANVQEPMQQEPPAEAESEVGEDAEERREEVGEEEEETEKGADENVEGEEEDALNLLGKIKMEVDSDSEVVKIKEEQMDPEEEEEEGAGGEEEEGEEGEEKKSAKRKSAESDGEGDEADKDNEKKKKKTDGSGSDSDSDKKDRLDRKNANFRRNIREVMDESQLDQATLNAQRQEMERLKRVQEQHRIIREVQKQIQMNKQNSKTETRVISLLQGNTSLLKTSASAPAPSSSQSQNTVVVKLSSGSGAPQIVNKKVLEMLRSQKPEPAKTAAQSTSKVTSLARSLLNKPHMMTPSVSIAPVKPKSPSAAPDSPAASATASVKVEPGAGGDMAAIRKVTGKAKGKDVVTISSSSSSDEDDCILISEPSEGEEEEEEEDPTNSGMHTNDTYNVPDDQGRVLINVGHPTDEPDVFLAPQIARIIKPHQIGGVRFLFDNVVESLERFKTSSGFGCILAHSMGLGKTLQVVSFCDVFLRHTEARTVLCIMPINTLQNWLAEFNMWLPTDPTNCPLAAHGDVRPRNFPIYVLNDLQKTITARAKVVAEWSKQGGVLLIGYELYRQLSLKRPRKVRRGKKKFDPDDDFDNNKNKPLLEEMHTALVKPGPDLIICDEGHRIKNSHASISQALKQIRSKRRVVLTGYPLQNNLLEYWCMVDFVRPNYLGTKTEFSNMFERPIQNGQCIDSTPQDIRLMRYRAHVLHSLLEGFVQRRSHSVLTHTLPQKEEYVLLIRMTPFQRKLYDTFMNEVVRTKAVPNPLKAFAVCCKIWNHPDVLYHFLKKRANTGEAVDLDLDETAPIVPPCPPPNMPGGIILPPLPGALQPMNTPPLTPGAPKPPAPAKRGRGRSPKNPNAPKRERKKPQSAAASKTPAVAAVMPNATSNTDNADNKNQGQLPMNNQGNSGPMNQPPGDANQPCPPYNQSYNNPNQFNQYQSQSQSSYSNMGDQPSNYNQSNYGSQPPSNEFQNQFQPNYPNQNNSFNSSDNFYQNYGNYYPQNPQDGNNTNYNNPGYWGNNSYYNNTDNPSNFFEGGQFNETGNSGQQQWNQDNFNQQSSNSNYSQGFGSNSGSQGYGSGTGSNQNLNATATSGALNQQMQQDQQSNSYSDLQKMEQMGQQRTQTSNMQQGGLYGSVQNDGGNMLGSSGQSSQGHGPSSTQNQGMMGAGQSNSNFMNSNQPANSMLPPAGSNMQGGAQHQNPAGSQSMMQLGASNMNMMSGGHPPPGMHGSSMMGMSSMMSGSQPDGSSMLQPLGSGQNSFGSNQMMGTDHNQGGMNTLHHMSGNDQMGGGQGNMMGGMHNQGMMPPMNQSNLEGGNNDLIPPPNLQQNSRQHPMMAGRPGPGLPGGGQNKIPPPQPISQSGSMMQSHQQHPPPYDNQNYMGNMHLQNQGMPGNMQDMSGSQGMMMHGMNHPGLSNQQQNPTGMDPNFHKSQDGSDGGGMYRSSYSMPSSAYHPPTQADNHPLGPMSGYRPQTSHQQQSQHDKLIDDLFNNPSNDMGGSGQDSSNQDNRGGIMGMSPIKNTGNNMSGGMVNIQSKPVNQPQQFQAFNQTYNDPPQHGYDSGASNQNQTGFNQSDLMGNYQSTSSTSVGGNSGQNYPSSSSVSGGSGQSFPSSTSVGGGGSGQNYPMSGNTERGNQYHDQQGMMNSYQNVPQQFESGSSSNFGGQSQGGYSDSLQNTSGNYQQQSNYMANMFGGGSGNTEQSLSTSTNQQQSSGLNEGSQSGFSASVKEDKTTLDDSKDEKSSTGQKNWPADSKKVEEKSEPKSEATNAEEDDDEKEMKSCGNQTEEKADVKAETMVKDTSYTFGEMKEVGGAMKDAATGEDDKQEGKTEGATTTPTPLVKSGKEDPGIPYDWAERLLKGYIPGDIEASAKMAILFCILEESINLGDRILVFSQSLFTLNLIEDFLQKTNLPNRAERWARNWNYYRLDGSTSALEREKLINEFNSNPNIHLFLVSTRAGSLGINLVGANRVIVFDASWNPCHDTQAVCRVYRYGQKKPCFVYRLVMDHCLEKKIYDRQINKQGMSDRVVDECNPDAHLSIKEVTNLCWDSEETDSKPMPDVATLKDKYIDVVMQKVLDRHGQTLSKEPFQHESLLVDRKDKKLSQAEKRLAKRSYELEKQASINSRPVYGYSGGGNQQGLQIRPTFRAIRGEGGGGVVNKPMASVRPMQSELNSQLARGADGTTRPRSWIPAEVWQKQGMSAQEMTLPLDVVIPTNSPDRSSIVLKAGQKVMVLKSPKGIYMQLENGKIIAIRTAIKVGNKTEKKTDKREFTFEGKKEVAVQPNRARVQSLPILRNNISIIPRGGGATGITSRGGGTTGGGGNRPLARMLGQNSNRPWGTPKQPIATTKPYFGETPPVTVTVTKKKVDAPTSSTLRGQAKVERNPSTEESKDKVSDDNTGETSTDDKDKQPQRSASASSGASEASRQDSSSAEISGSAATKRKISAEQERLRSTEEELLHDVDDDDYDDEDDDDDDDDEDDEELDNHHHLQQQRQASHRMRTMASQRQAQQRHALAIANQQAAAKKNTFSSSGSNAGGQNLRSASPSVSAASTSSTAASHSHQASAGNKMVSNTATSGQQSSIGSHSTSMGATSSLTTTSSVSSHSTTSTMSSSPHTSTSSMASHSATPNMGSHAATTSIGHSTTSTMAAHATATSMASHSTTSNLGSTLSSHGASMGSLATTSSIGSHTTTSSMSSSAPSASLGAAPMAEKESRHPQMMSHHHHHQMSQHHAPQPSPVSNPPPSRNDDREYSIHSRYNTQSSSATMSKSGSESSHISASSHPPLPKHLSSSVTVSPVASSAPSISVPMNSPNTSRPSSAVSINPPFNPPHPSVSMTPVSANPPPTYHPHTPGQTSSTSSSSRRYTSTEYTADALSKSSEPTSYHPALSHLKTISDHSISIFPVDSSKPAVPSSTITSAQYGGSDYNYRQDFHPSRQAPASRDYYQGFGQPPLSSYPSGSSTSGYYPSSTVTSSSAQRKDVKDTPYSGSYDQAYLPPNPFTAAAVGSGYTSRSSSYHPQSTPPPSQPSTTSSYSTSGAAAGSSSSTSDFSRMYSAFHRPEPSSFQPPSRPAVGAPPSPHQFPPATPYNYNPYLMQPHPAYPHLPPPGSQPPPQ